MATPSVFRHFRGLSRPSLFALFVLLFTATHCVDIDDRDLEVTDGDDDSTGGGSTDVCAPTEKDNDCTLCSKYNCCGEAEVCADSPDCQDFANCWDPCTDDACVDSCIEQYPYGASEFADFINCTYDYCLDVCS